MLKISKLMLVSALWFGVYVQAAEAVPTGDHVAKAVAQYTVPGFTREDIQFVGDAYLRYQKTIAGYEKQREESNKKDYLTQSFSKKTELVDYESLIRLALIYYCNTLLSWFYRSQLDAMANAAPLNFKVLQEALEVACKGIDQIGAEFIQMVHRGNIDNVREEINRLRKAHTLKIALNAKNKYGITALMDALRYNYIEILQELLSLKDASGQVLVDVNTKDQFGWTPLMFGCNKGLYAGVVQELLRLKDASGKFLVDVNAVKKNGDTALIFACDKGYVYIIPDLLEHGANILHNNDENKSALGILHEKLMDASVSTVDKAKIRSILDVFDALKPNLTPKKLAGMGQGALELKNAYVEFQKGKPKRLMFVINSRLIPGISGSVKYQKGHVKAGEKFLNEDVMSNEIQTYVILDTLAEVFKAESIVPLLEWLVKVISYQPMPQPKAADLQDLDGFKQKMQEVQTRFKNRLERLLDLAKKS